MEVHVDQGSNTTNLAQLVSYTSKKNYGYIVDTNTCIDMQPKTIRVGTCIPGQ